MAHDESRCGTIERIRHASSEVISAHEIRTFGRIVSGAIERGLKVIIAERAGGAIRAGVTAAFTTLPVIGVPILGKSLMASIRLLSMVQNAAGVVTVATVPSRRSQRR